ncbi:MAG: proton-conducting transporter membrane subunit, partial [bacterium]
MNEFTFLGALIIGVPMATLVLLVLFNTKLPRWGDWLATATMGFSLLLSIYLFYEAWTAPAPLNATWSFEWISLGGAHAVSTGLKIDNLTTVMLVVVTLISFLVLLFSMGYMHGDARYGRYYAYLVLFTISMLGLVLTDNLLHLYVFWEIMGLSSYLLIGHYFEKDSANYAAKKAFIVTRIGDIGMFIGIMIIYWKTGTFRYDEIFQAVADQKLYGLWQFWAGIGVFMGAVGKSA